VAAVVAAAVCVSVLFSSGGGGTHCIYNMYIVLAYLAGTPGYVSRSVGVHVAHYSSPISFMVPRTPTLASSIWIAPYPCAFRNTVIPFTGTFLLSRPLPYPLNPSTVSPHVHPGPPCRPRCKPHRKPRPKSPSSPPPHSSVIPNLSKHPPPHVDQTVSSTY